MGGAGGRRYSPSLHEISEEVHLALMAIVKSCVSDMESGPNCRRVHELPEVAEAGRGVCTEVVVIIIRAGDVVKIIGVTVVTMPLACRSTESACATFV